MLSRKTQKHHRTVQDWEYMLVTTHSALCVSTIANSEGRNSVGSSRAPSFPKGVVVKESGSKSSIKSPLLPWYFRDSACPLHGVLT